MADQHERHRPLLVWLDDIQATYPGVVGSKTASLAVLRGHGFAVPDGFAVTAEAYRLAVETAGVETALSYPVGLCANTCAESRFRAGLVAQAEMPAAIVKAIADSYTELGRRLGRPNPAVAVRTSVVDEEATFGPTAVALTGIAGAEGVIDGVAACWEALFNEQALVTRVPLGQHFEPAMAVLVQDLVPTVRSGTAYSTDPVQRRPFGRSPFCHVLSDDQAQGVAATVVRAEAVLGQPVAMDWSLRRDGAVVVLEVHTMSSAARQPDRSLAQY
jgi:pyruvate,water dikinase